MYKFFIILIYVISIIVFYLLFQKLKVSAPTTIIYCHQPLRHMLRLPPTPSKFLQNLANIFGVQAPVCLQSKKNWSPHNVGRVMVVHFHNNCID